MVHSMKTCPKCKESLSIDLFYVTNNRPSPYCKECQKEYRKSLYNEKTREREKQTSAEYRKKYPEESRMKVRMSKRRYKALKAGLKHEYYTEQEIIDVYGTNCYICNLPVDYNAPKIGPGSDFASWPDHVIPTSKGGEDTIRNVRTCHKKCNYNKRDKTYDEYMLTVNSQKNVTQPLQ